MEWATEHKWLRIYPAPDPVVNWAKLKDAITEGTVPTPPGVEWTERRTEVTVSFDSGEPRQ